MRSRFFVYGYYIFNIVTIPISVVALIVTFMYMFCIWIDVPNLPGIFFGIFPLMVTSGVITLIMYSTNYSVFNSKLLNLSIVNVVVYFLAIFFFLAPMFLCGEFCCERNNIDIDLIELIRSVFK